MLPIVDVNVVTAVLVVVPVVVAIILVFAGITSGVDVVVFDITVALVVRLQWKITRQNN